MTTARLKALLCSVVDMPGNDIWRPLFAPNLILEIRDAGATTQKRPRAIAARGDPDQSTGKSTYSIVGER